MITPIVWIELNSIQVTKSISVIQVICNRRVVFPYDCPDFLNIINFETTGMIRTIWTIMLKPGF